MSRTRLSILLLINKKVNYTNILNLINNINLDKSGIGELIYYYLDSGDSYHY